MDTTSHTAATVWPALRYADAPAAIRFLSRGGRRPRRWDSPSPCEEWTARDVVGHVVETQGMFLGLVGRELADPGRRC